MVSEAGKVEVVGEWMVGQRLDRFLCGLVLFSTSECIFAVHPVSMSNAMKYNALRRLRTAVMQIAIIIFRLEGIFTELYLILFRETKMVLSPIAT